MYFSMIGNAIMGRHRSIKAAQRAINKRYNLLKRKYTRSCYFIAKLESPGYWDIGDTPYPRYYMEVYDHAGVVRLIKKGVI